MFLCAGVSAGIVMPVTRAGLFCWALRSCTSINAGTPELWIDELNGWTVHTADGKDSAQWEHTLLITEGEPEVLSW